MPFRSVIAGSTYSFPTLATLLAKASPARAGDRLAGLAAENAVEQVAAKLALADVPLKSILAEPVVPYDEDDVTRLILDTHDARAFQFISQARRSASCASGRCRTTRPRKPQPKSSSHEAARGHCGRRAARPLRPT